MRRELHHLQALECSGFVLFELLALGCQTMAPNAALTSKSPILVESASHEPIELTIIGDSDVHGALDSQNVPLTFGNGQVRTLGVGGAETMSAYYQRERDMNPGGVVLVSAGDFFIIARQCESNRHGSSPR
jgi:5'-nucleotidase